MASDGRTVLLIHDDVSVASVLAAVLEEESITVHLAPSAPQGIRDLRKLEPDVVLTRNEMPMLGGRHVLRAVGTAEPDLPVVVLADSGDLSLVVDLMRLGAQDCVLDPMSDPRVVLGVVELALERAASRQGARKLEKELAEAHARMARLLEQEAVIRERAFARVSEPLELATRNLQELSRVGLLAAQHKLVEESLSAVYTITDRLTEAQTDASRTSTRSLSLEDFHPQDVAEFVRDAVLREAHGKGIEFAYLVPADVVPFRGDPKQLRATLTELTRFLIGRSSAGRNQGGVVHLTLTVESRGPGPWLVRFDLSNSQGSDAIEGEDVLERYLPGDDVVTVRDDLIDLSMAARAVGVLGGELELFERRGVGLRFSFDLALLVAKRTNHVLADPGLRPADVVLAEPNNAVRRCVANELRKLGMRVAVAGSADQALTLLDRAAAGGAGPKVVFLSLALPDRAKVDEVLDASGPGLRRIYLAKAGEYAPSSQGSLLTMRPPRRNVLIEVLKKSVGLKDEA